MRFIRLNGEGIVVFVRNGTSIVEGEIESETGQIGQRMIEDGTFIDVPIEPIEPQPTIEEKLTILELQLQEQQMQNLILVDINLTVYEELLNMKDQLAQLTGATDNA